MSRRFWTRLAGWLATSCALAATPEYEAGFAVQGPAKALVLEDRRGNRAVFAEAEFPISRTLSDFIAARLLKEQNLDRSAVVFRGMGVGTPDAGAVVAAIDSAVQQLAPAKVAFDGAVISVRTEDDACLFAIPAGSCGGGVAVRAPIRAAFQMVETETGLQKRGEIRTLYPVQAIAFGKEAAILALGGDARYSPSKGVVVVRFANDTVAAPETERLNAAIRRVLSRAGR